MARFSEWLRPLVLLVSMPMLATAQFGYWTNNGTITIGQYYGSGGAVIIPSSIDGLPVATIWDHTFQGNLDVTSVTFPGSITNIGDYAFYACASLTDVVIEDSATRIGVGAFAYCSSLTNCAFGSSVTGIDSYAFLESSLATIAIPDTVTNIGNDAFSDCANLAGVTIGSGVKNIGDNAFSDCTSLGEIYFSGDAPIPGSTVFLNDTATVFYIPGTAGWGAFFGELPTAPWRPKIVTGSSGFGVHTNQFGFDVGWASGQTIIVEACTNLANPAWTSLETNTLTAGFWHFDDPEWLNHPNRFYRLRSQ